MKKIISTILVCVLLLGCVMSLASCGKMFSGKYEANLVAAKVTYDFKFGGKVILTVDPILGNSSTFEGKYEINDETNEITFVFEAEDAESYSGTSDFSQGEEDGVKYIKIGLVKYTEVKE
jgi:hypothetical protein